MTPTYQIEQLNFDGPLDLLLHLLERNKVDIMDIPVAEITEQYMEYVGAMEEEDLELVSDFLVMAATLLEIKARMLLPKEKNEEGEELDPRAELVERLLEYKRFKYMAGELSDYEVFAERYFYREADIPEEVSAFAPPPDLDSFIGDVSFADLERVFREVMARSEEKVDRVRANFGVIRRDRISLTDRIGSVLGYAKKHRRFSFRQILSESRERMEVVVTFLALLELMKMGKISVSQPEALAEIEVQAAEGIDAGEEPDLSDISDL